MGGEEAADTVDNSVAGQGVVDGQSLEAGVVMTVAACILLVVVANQAVVVAAIVRPWLLTLTHPIHLVLQPRELEEARPEEPELPMLEAVLREEAACFPSAMASELEQVGSPWVEVGIGCHCW